MAIVVIIFSCTSIVTSEEVDVRELRAEVEYFKVENQSLEDELTEEIKGIEMVGA